MGGQLLVSILSSIIVLIAYSFLLFTMVDPIVTILLLSLAESFLPTILLSMVPGTVASNKYGAAFGLVEITASLTGLFVNIIMGYIKDVTASYFYDLLTLMVLGGIGTLLLLYLQVIDLYYNLGMNMPTAFELDSESMIALEEN